MVLAHNINQGSRTRDIDISVNVTFDSMMLSNRTLEGLKNSGFYRPSPIQLHGIPLGKCGFDLFLEAKSGTGKTAVFTVIALEKLDVNKGLQTIILAPTREIAAQVSDVIKQIGSGFKDLVVEVVMGGLPVEKDIEKFQQNVHILVGSPGRMRHLIQNRHLNISAVRLLVLDEADKLMDGGFTPDINYIFSVLPKEKQVIMSSATYPDTLKDVMQNYVVKAQHICPDSSLILLGIRQFVTTVKGNTNVIRQTQFKFQELLKILSNQEFKQCLIFCNYQARVRDLCRMLKLEKWPAEKLHGQLEQNERLDALRTLQQYKCRILVSTDLAARGIDASNVDIVINFEVPFEWQTYLHRIGRTGRFGSHGIAITIISEGKEHTMFKNMIKNISHSLTLKHLWTESNFELDESDDANCELGETSTQVILTSSDVEISSNAQAGAACEIPEVKAALEELTESVEVSIRKQSEVEGIPKLSEVVKMCKMLDLEEMKLLDTVEEKVKKDIETSKCGTLENNEDDYDCANIINTFEAPEQSTIESFHDLINSFKVHEPNNNEAIEIEDVNLKTYFDSLSNIETRLQVLESDSDNFCEVKVHNTDECITQLKTVIKSPTTVQENPEGEINGDSLKKTDTELKELSQDKKDSDKSHTNHYALDYGDLPLAFGSRKHRGRVTEPRSINNNGHTSHKQKSNKVHKQSQNKNESQEQPNYKVLRETNLKSSSGSPGSYNDDGYNTHSCQYSRATKYAPSQTNESPNNVIIRNEICSNNKGISKRSNANSKYETWYTQLKTHMIQVEMSLYMDELSKIYVD